MKVLVSGAGIAGPCLAYWLSHHGYETTLVERAPRLRTGGYVVDFWGAGFDVADRMGLVPELRRRGYAIEELREVDRTGAKVSGFDVRVFDRVTHGRFTTIARSDLAETLFDALDGKVETIFDDSIAGIDGIDDRDGKVAVSFERSRRREFDLVVGADGLHSQVRKLVFGDDARFEHYLGMKVAAFTAPGYRPRDELAYVVHAEVKQQVGRFAMRDDKTMFLFVFADPDPGMPPDLEGQKRLVRDRFAGSGWECPQILAALDEADNVYIDRVSQIRMDHWSRGRVALVGDAAFCVSLLAGQGSALAMVAAYVLAGELKRAGGDHEAAFAEYEARLRALIAGKQRGAVRFASFFAPPSRLRLFLRNQAMKLMAIAFLAEITVGRELGDAIELPSY